MQGALRWLTEVSANLRPPLLALVTNRLERDAENAYFFTLGSGLKSLGYAIEVIAQEGGPMADAWRGLAFPAPPLSPAPLSRPSLPHLSPAPLSHTSPAPLFCLAIPPCCRPWDFLPLRSYQGVLANSLEATPFIAKLAQEPFTEVPLVWVVHEADVADRLAVYESSQHLQGLRQQWVELFARPDALVFPCMALKERYQSLNTGNFVVIPGSPTWTYAATRFAASHSPESERAARQIPPDTFTVAVAGNQRVYQGKWRERAMAMHAVQSLVQPPGLGWGSIWGWMVGDAVGKGGGQGGGGGGGGEGRREQRGGGRGRGGEGNQKEREGVSAVERAHVVFMGSWNTSGSQSQLAVLKVVAKHLLIANLTWGVGEAEGEEGMGVLMASDVVVWSSVEEEREVNPLLVKALALGKVIVVPKLIKIRAEGMGVLMASDVVVWSSVEEEREVNPLLVKALALGKVVVAPKLIKIRAELTNGVHALFYDSGKEPSMKQVLLKAASLSQSDALAMSASGRELSLALDARSVVKEVARLLERVMEGGVGIRSPRPADWLWWDKKQAWMWGEDGGWGWGEGGGKGGDGGEGGSWDVREGREEGGVRKGEGGYGTGGGGKTKGGEEEGEEEGESVDVGGGVEEGEAEVVTGGESGVIGGRKVILRKGDYKGRRVGLKEGGKEKEGEGRVVGTGRGERADVDTSEGRNSATERSEGGSEGGSERRRSVVLQMEEEWEELKRREAALLMGDKTRDSMLMAEMDGAEEAVGGGLAGETGGAGVGAGATAAAAGGAAGVGGGVAGQGGSVTEADRNGGAVGVVDRVGGSGAVLSGSKSSAAVSGAAAAAAAIGTVGEEKGSAGERTGGGTAAAAAAAAGVPELKAPEEQLEADIVNLLAAAAAAAELGLKTRAGPVEPDSVSRFRYKALSWVGGEEVKVGVKRLPSKLLLSTSLSLLSPRQLWDRREHESLSWEEVKVGVKRAERSGLHERDDGDLERSGQPICIYEPYTGNGSWPFIHDKDTLYRGVSLSRSSRRPNLYDDVNAWARLPMLASPYYRDVLCDFAAMLAINYRIDRVHRNPWIGFQPWRVRAENVGLSGAAEKALVGTIEGGTVADAVVYWVSIVDQVEIHRDPRKLPFLMPCGWCTACPPTGPPCRPWRAWPPWTTLPPMATGGGTSPPCSHADPSPFFTPSRAAFLEAMRLVYSLPSNWTTLPPMPTGGGTWSAMHAWAMPAHNFVEFMLFARMFVDALDVKFYQRHAAHGTCPLAQSHAEERHCYCRLLDRLVNVWAYHSRKRMLLLNPHTGSLQEQHPVPTRSRSRSRRAWFQWFSRPVLKAMDEERAEETDDPAHAINGRRWLWPHLGEVQWQGSIERDRMFKLWQKGQKERKKKERLARMRVRYKQEALGGPVVKTLGEVGGVGGLGRNGSVVESGEEGKRGSGGDGGSDREVGVGKKSSSSSSSDTAQEEGKEDSDTR
ncbi:unnamed protein product [Closterium sp. NIES-65]|nr:unnamed protein product [Closterium sp. NIES-65]